MPLGRIIDPDPVGGLDRYRHPCQGDGILPRDDEASEGERGASRPSAEAPEPEEASSRYRCIYRRVLGKRFPVYCPGYDECCIGRLPWDIWIWQWIEQEFGPQ